ncbi:MAG: hypothetical protein AMXMBFR45_22030 [Gammaproteobacteria bacterium]|nr:MAG: hypothetical protein BroJett010_03640 [Gammaproteobacteria bacterium]
MQEFGHWPAAWTLVLGAARTDGCGAQHTGVCWAKHCFYYKIPATVESVQAPPALPAQENRSTHDMLDQQLRAILRDALQLGERAARLEADSALLGALPELDSMAVVEVITALEDQFGIVVHDDEISADTFATFGSLVHFVQGKVTQ